MKKQKFKKTKQPKKKTNKKPKSNKGKKYEKPLSLYPLSFEEVVETILKTKPVKKG